LPLPVFICDDIILIAITGFYLRRHILIAISDFYLRWHHFNCDYWFLFAM